MVGVKGLLMNGLTQIPCWKTYKSNHFKHNKGEPLVELANDPLDETGEELMDVLIQEYLVYFQLIQMMMGSLTTLG